MQLVWIRVHTWKSFLATLVNTFVTLGNISHTSKKYLLNLHLDINVYLNAPFIVTHLMKAIALGY